MILLGNEEEKKKKLFSQDDDNHGLILSQLQMAHWFNVYPSECLSH